MATKAPKIEVQQLDGWIGVSEAADRLKISRSAIHKNIGLGRITSARKTAGKFTVILMREVEINRLVELNPDGGMALTVAAAAAAEKEAGE